MAERRRHVHKYKRKWLGKYKDYEVYACVLPGCRHYTSPSLLEGKEYICWRCGVVQVATVSTKELAKPHCRTCTKGNKKDIKTNFKEKDGLPEIDLSDLL